MPLTTTPLRQKMIIGTALLLVLGLLNACVFFTTSSADTEDMVKTKEPITLAEADKATILDIMQRQESCWNTADVDCYMNGYWQSDSLRFMGKKGITYGYRATLERYKKSYPDAAAMGQLSFGLESIEALSDNMVLLLGTYHLKRTGEGIEDLSGYYSLLWKKINGEWVIVLDHSS